MTDYPDEYYDPDAFPDGGEVGDGDDFEEEEVQGD